MLCCSLQGCCEGSQFPDVREKIYLYTLYIWYDKKNGEYSMKFKAMFQSINIGPMTVIEYRDTVGADAISDIVQETYVTGDTIRVRKALDATKESYEVAAAL